LNDVLKILGHELEMTAKKYISETSAQDRANILRDFSRQEIQFVVSMRCLDEGVDLPDARIAYILASSTDPRQWVQRRGRILRRSSNGEEKLAEIIDFVTLPAPGEELNALTKDLLDKEIERIEVFGSDSENEDEATRFIEALRADYGKDVDGN